jgi:hypothetical protein
MPSRPLNYTTKVPVRQTVGECVNLLAEAGADRVAIVYDNKQPVGLSFRLEMESGWQDFTLPVNVTAMAKRLATMDYPPRYKGKELASLKTPQHAAAVAWRVVKDWLEAQLAIIAAEMATLDQVMLPYLQLAEGTLYEVVRDRHLALEAPRD